MEILAMCVTMATTMGLNKPGAARSRRTSNGDKRICHRIWLTLFCYENLFSFELGRASCIIDEHCYFPQWEDVGLGESTDSRLVEMIGKDRYEEQIGKDRVEEAISEKVKVTNETCRDVLQWAGSLPPDMRPDSDLISFYINHYLAPFAYTFTKPGDEGSKIVQS
ncbi:fungal specific transcription factor domain-containing protein [Penicillium cataractarum]|uniref:Fungal specific transcription factor domain-containing protein n=1 Tax=Penicillium cataractarum TaxID=2100454 RepID=A0A9W9UVK1_9EURO|nr:fungal specific transcription factor domain-containing protein [Penicillium cataractarum]KAJ5359108.1 fungal specific transcription factor domain-containing protein [Penicillium cataractarum]